MTCVPLGARGVSIAAPVGAAWVNSAWAELISAANAPAVGWAIDGIHVENILDIAEVEIDLGFGGSGSETVAATFRMGGSVNTAPCVLLLPILLEVAATTRVSCRVRSRAEIGGASATGTQWVKLLYYLTQPTGVSRSTAILKAAPPAAQLSLTVPSSAWTNGSWVQVTASTSEDWQLAAVNITEANLTFAAAGDEYEIDVGVGAGGSEVVITTVRAHVRQSASSSIGIIMDPILIDAIPSGSRVAMRARHRVASATTFNVALQYYGGSL